MKTQKVIDNLKNNMKNIEYVFNIYFGQDVVIKVWSQFYNKKLTLAPKFKIGKLTAVDLFKMHGRYSVKTSEGNTSFNEGDLLLILKPLSEITSEDSKYLLNLEVNQAQEISSNTRTEAMKTIYLIQRGYDLFKLIESGFALDSKTIK